MLLERGRVADVDDDVGAGQRLRNASAGNAIDACRRRCAYNFVAFGPQDRAKLAADEASTSDNDDFHRVSSGQEVNFEAMTPAFDEGERIRIDDVGMRG